MTDVFGPDDRSVSITLNYVLVLGIAAILVSGLLLAGGLFVEDQREGVIENELTVIAHHIAGDIEQVDRMAQAGIDTERAEINRSFQQQVSGTGYDVALEDGRVVLTSISPEVEVAVRVDTVTPHDEEDRFITGGDISIQYDPDGDGRLVIYDG